MAITLPVIGTPDWGTPLNLALTTLDNDQTNHDTGIDPHGDRGWANAHILGVPATGPDGPGEALASTSTSGMKFAGTMGTGDWVFNVQRYNAKGNGKTVTDGAITAATNTLVCATSAPFASTDVGKLIMIKGAAANGVTSHSTTIATFVSSTTVTLTANAVTTVASGGQVMFASDDTASIQGAVNAAVTYARANNGVATVFFPGSTGFYGVGGTLVTGGSTHGNAQITLPIIPVAEKKVILTFQGATDGSGLQHWQQTVPQTSGAIVSFGVFTSISGQSNSITANGNACVIGGPAQPAGYGTSALLYSNMKTTLRDLSVLTAFSTFGLTYSAFDFSGLSCGKLSNFAYGTTGTVVSGDYGTPSSFSAGLSFGGLMPANGNNDESVIENTICHGGYTYAILATEHAVVNRMVLLYCWSAYCVSGSYFSSAGASHAYWANQLSVESCINVVYIFGQGASGIGPFIDIQQLDTEVGAPVFADNGGGGLRFSLGTVKLTGLYTQANVTTGGLPTGLIITDGQNPGGVRSVSATASVGLLDRVILGNTTSAGFTVTLLSAVANQVPVSFRNTGSANTLTIACVGGQTINGSATLGLTTGQTARLVSNGTNWFTI